MYVHSHVHALMMRKSCVCADDAKIMCSRDAQCNTAVSAAACALSEEVQLIEIVTSQSFCFFFFRSENLSLVDLMNMLEVKMKPHFLHQLRGLIYLRFALSLYSITK